MRDNSNNKFTVTTDLVYRNNLFMSASNCNCLGSLAKVGLFARVFTACKYPFTKEQNCHSKNTRKEKNKGINETKF